MHESILLTESWEQEGVGVESIEPVLRFMEEHPHIDYGMPGYLTTFVEQFTDGSYEARLVESILRKPTSHTVWMLNRHIKVCEGADRARFLQLMESVKQNPHADPLAVEQADDFLRWHASHP